MSDRAWLVTGASGFLGRHLLEIIEADPMPRRAVALVRDTAAWQAMEWTRHLARVQPVEGDLLAADGAELRARLGPIGGIFHLAALVGHTTREAGEVYRTNVDGTLAVVRLAAKERCRLVFVSTSGTVACFRRPGETADEESPHRPDEVARWPYYDSKVRAEREARRLAGELGVELVIVRPPVLLGPRDHRRRSTRHVLRFLEGKLPFVIRGGMHFADVRDVARALVRIMVRPDVRPVYHLPGMICSIEEFYRMTAEAAGRNPPALVLPYRVALWLAQVSARLGLGLLPDPRLVEMASHHWAMRSKYAEEELGYRSRPGRETLADTVAWLRGPAREDTESAAPRGGHDTGKVSQ